MSKHTRPINTLKRQPHPDSGMYSCTREPLRMVLLPVCTGELHTAAAAAQHGC